MKNLAAVVTKDAIVQALEDVIANKPKLIPATKFHIIYKKQAFPPKEIVRIAARKMGIYNHNNYRLVGGKSTNRHLVAKGFIIDQFRHWQTTTNNMQSKGNEQRIARLTYNTNGWQYPSGGEGKSKSKDSYETMNGYGHEEWLFDFTKLIDGYHYGFLEPVHKSHSKYEGNIYDIYLYSINSKTGEKFWVGKLNNAEVIDKATADEITDVYIENGWYGEMKEDLEKLELDSAKLDNWQNVGLFNVRFKPEDFEKYPDKTYVDEDDTSISSYYYVLLHLNNEPKIVTQADGKFVLGRCNPSRRHTKKTIKKKFEQKLIEYPFIHHQISVELEKTLKKDYDKVYPEHQTGYKTSIDLVGVKGKKTHFFEIKTYNDIRTCIRQAIGQLLEYSYFPDKKIADEIFIVTPHFVKDQNTINYLNNLRDNVGLPIRYICYNLDMKDITQTI